MLVINVEASEEYDEESETFNTVQDFTIELEHSLVSISKWEEIYQKPFLSGEAKTQEETIQYIVSMNLGPEIPESVLRELHKSKYLDQVNSYLGANHTATWFNDPPQTPGRSREVVTAEIVYYWLVALNIPFETQYWNFNRLLTLVKVVNSKNAPPKKMGRREAAAHQRQLNASRRAQYGTRG